jgi:hypothetical protein
VLRTPKIAVAEMAAYGVLTRPFRQASADPTAQNAKLAAVARWSSSWSPNMIARMATRNCHGRRIRPVGYAASAMRSSAEWNERAAGSTPKGQARPTATTQPRCASGPPPVAAAATKANPTAASRKARLLLVGWVIVLAHAVAAPANRRLTNHADRANRFESGRPDRAAMCAGNFATITYSCEAGHSYNRAPAR